MKPYGRVWLYQCVNHECGLAACINDVVLAKRYGTSVPCPRCERDMEKVREAREGEYDPELQEASLDMQLDQGKITMIRPSKAYSESGAGSEKTLFTEVDVAGLLNISPNDVRRLVREKRLGYIPLTKRKKAFTKEIIDEFLRRESGFPMNQGTGTGGLAPQTPTRGIPLDESRELLRKLRKRDQT